MSTTLEQVRGSMAQLPLRFDGSDIIHDRDCNRLTGQLLKIYELMKDGRPRTLEQISAATGEPPASISAQLRNFRKQRFSFLGVDFDKKYLGSGLYSYWLFKR